MGQEDLNLYFIYRCWKGFKKRGLSGNQIYEDRLTYEISVITKMGYSGYFLIVSDVMTWALDHNIPTSVRGSGTGSLAAYSLHITHIDPLQYGLIFERFLNPDRASMPDFDMDFADLQRQEVIQYVVNKYGTDKVARIGTFNTMKAKGAIRDITRTLGHPYDTGDKLARLTLDPIDGKHQSLETCYEKVPELKAYRFGEESIEKDILIWAEKVENKPRSYGTHAGGIVISREPISSIIPLYPGKEGMAATQFEMNTVEEVGLIKFDFLGLKTLSTIKRCLDIIKEKHQIIIDMLKVPVDDEETYKLLQSGDTIGVFQLETSEGIRDLLVRIKPTCIEDLSTLVATYRPGPLASSEFQHFLKVKAGEASPHYIVKELEPILKNTSALMVYQEQIMHISQQLAGYTMADADILRKGISKKVASVINNQETKFVQGMVANNFKESDARHLFADIKNFGAYCFCKPHSIMYAFVGYQTAWLKCHYPIEFICACLITDSNENDKIIKYINYCKSKNIQVLPPSINESGYEFSISGKAIRFGLGAIKNIGKPIQDLIQERKKNGPFLDILDFARRIDIGKINKKKLECLVLSGAFDVIGNTKYNRASLLGAIDEIHRYKYEQKIYESKLETYVKHYTMWQARTSEVQIWNSLTKEERKQTEKKKPNLTKKPVKPIKPKPPFIPEMPELTSDEIFTSEKELLGFYISGHPLDKIQEKTPLSLNQIKLNAYQLETKQKHYINLIAVPSLIKISTTKKTKEKMCSLVLEDKSATIQCVVLPKIYAQNKNLIKVNVPALYKLELEIVENDTEKLIKSKILKITSLISVKKRQTKPIDMIIPIKKAEKIAKFLIQNKGKKSCLNLIIKSKNNYWNFGLFNSKFDRSEVRKKVKENI